MKKVNGSNKKVKQVDANLAKMTKAKCNAGSCIGVKYPCIYHCKKCIFDTIYCTK